MSNYIIENDLQDVEFIKKSHHGAFLVRQDTGMLLRKSDFEEVPEDAEDEFYVWDPERNTAVLYGTGALSRALEGSYEYEGITVTTSYTLLKEQLSQYVVADAVAETGMTEETIEHLAACSRRAMLFR